MMKTMEEVFAGYQDGLIELARSLVRIQSFSGHEEEAVRRAARVMTDLGFDEVKIDGMGNVLGRIGSGAKSILFDSHLDVVAVNDAEKWRVPPFSAEILHGSLYGRGSVDMKSGAAASIYAAALARLLGWTAGKTVYVSCGVQEEECDGENLKYLFSQMRIRPDYTVICEPSNNHIALGHKGKAQVVIKTRGVSAHGSAPEKGKNAVYEMAGIIQRVEKTNESLMQKDGPHGTLVLSRISSTAASLNAVPSECEIYLDRRMVEGETPEMVKREMEALIDGKNAEWSLGTLQRRSWTGHEFSYEPLHAAWRLAEDHELSRAAIAAYEEVFGKAPQGFVYWDFSTNAVTPVSMGIPTIGFGPGEPKQAHMLNEHCPLSEIEDACRFYAQLIGKV